MQIFSFLRPPEAAEPVADPKQIDSDYRYWRFRTFYSMFVGYALYYFTRKSFTFAMPALISDLGYAKSDLGILATVLSLSYGLSKFGMGILGDRLSARYFMSIGLILTGLCNIFFGMSSSLIFFALFWGLNGIFQGCGWPPCAKMLSHWYSQNERGSWWSCWNVSHNIGGALIPLLVGICLAFFDWRYAMYIPGVLCIFGGFYVFERMRDTPQALGLPPIEDYRNDFTGTDRKKGEAEKELTTKQALFDYVLKNKFIWLLAFANFFVYIVRTAVNDWSALFLVETRHYAELTANGCVSLFEVGGFFGSLAAGWASDYLFNAKRGPVNAMFAFGMLFFISLLWFAAAGNPWVDSVLMFAIGFVIFGPQMLIGVAAAELAHKKAVATATGFTGWFAYIGAAIAGYPLGKITQDWGWDGYFYTVSLCCLLSIVVLIPLWGAQQQVRSKAPKLKPSPVTVK